MDSLSLARPSNDAGYRALLARLDALEGALSGTSALISQITATSGTATTEPWVAPSSWGDVATVTLAVPTWRPTGVTLRCGIFVRPEYDLVVESTEVYGRIVAVTTTQAGAISPTVVSSLLSLDVSAAMSWVMHLPVSPADDVVTVSAQAQSAGGTISGGRVTVHAVATWTR